MRRHPGRAPPSTPAGGHLAPYDDEDFTLEVRIPAGMDRDAVRDLCIRHALAIEDRFGFLILTRVKVAEAAEASA